jgi:succinate dehydrogenase / fumarate reductase cytochrome b subunit
MRVLNFYSTNIGKKIVVALTGAIMLGFLLLHVYGNFHVYFGAAKINEYSLWLREMGSHLFGYGGMLWIIRVVVGGALILHVITVAQLIARNRAARPVKYRKTSRRKRIIIGSTMAFSGLFILFFLIFHILQFTTGTLQPTPFHESNGIGIVYINLSEAFDVWWIVLLYVSAVAMVGFHVYHGAWSFFQTLGWNNPDRNEMFRWTAALLGLGLFFGFASVPILFWSGALPAPDQPSVQVEPVHEELVTWN